MKKAKKLLKKSNKHTNHLKHGWIAVVSGIVLVFILGVVATLGYQSLTKQNKELHQFISIEGSDGLMGLLGYGKPFALSDTVQYSVTYRNDSSVDRSIHIKATQFSRDPTENVREPGSGSLAGKIVRSSFSEKAIVKAGESRLFHVTVHQTTYPATNYIELEAFKSTDR